MVAAVMDDLPWQVHVSANQVWQRQQIVVEVSVKAPDPFALLKTDKLMVDGMEVKALPLTQDAKTQTLSLRWQLYPHGSGKQQIKLPPVRYYLFGGTKATWQAPVQTVNVQPLPPYMPPTLPVGQVGIESFIEPEGILTPGSLAYWHVSLHSKTVTTGQFPPLLKQLHKSVDIDVLPAKVSTNFDLASGEYQLDYLIPLKPKVSGRLDLPELQWHWFNPETARLEKQQYQPPRPWVLALWEKIALLMAAGILFGAGFFIVIKNGYRHFRRWRCKRRVFNVLQQNSDNLNEHKIRKALQDCARAHNWPAALSTRQWLSRWEKHYGENLQLHDYLFQYDKKRFAQTASIKK